MSGGRAYHSPAGEQETPGLDFLVRPRFGNKFCVQTSDQHRETAQLSSIFAKICQPASQAEALGQLGIRLLSRTRVQLRLQEFPPNYGGKPSAELELEQPLPPVLELRETFTTRNPVMQPIGIKVSYLGDAYTEADTAFCCLLEVSSPYGERFSVPVLGRGSFSYLGESDSRAAASGSWAAQREHCISGVSAGFLQRAALSLTALLCLCELSKEDDRAVIGFYHQVDKTYGYGFAPYLDYLAYCCQTSFVHRDTFLKYLCLEWNNSFTQDRMTQALTHFMEAHRPTQRFYDEVQSVMMPEELAKDRELHFSVKGKAVQASVYLRNAGRQYLSCCPCHVM